MFIDMVITEVHTQKEKTEYWGQGSFLFMYIEGTRKTEVHGNEKGREFVANS